MTKILVIAPSWVGDAVLAQPLFRRLHERHAGLTLDVLAAPWTQPLYARMPEIHDTVSSPFGHGELAIRRRYALARSLAAHAYDQAIVLPNSFKSALIPRIAGIARRTGYVGEARWCLLNDARRLDKKALPRLVDRYAMLAEDAGAPPRRTVVAAKLKIDEASRDAALTRLGITRARPVAILCPGAEFGPAKRWPSVYFATLASKLHGEGFDVWLVGSTRDAGAGDEIAANANMACINLCGKSSLSEAVDLISCASLVVSNDSGLMHVAAALDKPLVALYGSSSPAYTPPMSGRARVVTLGLACSPCFQRECPLGHFNCMKQLSPEHVWAHIEFDKIVR